MGFVILIGIVRFFIVCDILEIKNLKLFVLRFISINLIFKYFYSSGIIIFILID